MSKHLGPLLALSLGLSAGLLGCRASDEQCSELAAHVVDLATAEGKAGTGTALALEQDCKRLRPSSSLMQCMLSADSLDALRGC
jgi:hypothetical protein